MAKDGVMQQRRTGALRINNINEGRGTPLKFVKIPYSMSGAFLEELCGLDSTPPHPLKGAVYFVESFNEYFDVTVFQNDLTEDIAQAFANWFMGFCYMKYADFGTAIRVQCYKNVRPGTTRP